MPLQITVTFSRQDERILKKVSDKLGISVLELLQSIPTRIAPIYNVPLPRSVPESTQNQVRLSTKRLKKLIVDRACFYEDDSLENKMLALALHSDSVAKQILQERQLDYSFTKIPYNGNFYTIFSSAIN